MKKILLFLLVSISLVACSNDLEDTGEPQGNKTYKKVFGVKSFDVGVSPLETRALTGHNMKHVVYSDAGEVVAVKSANLPGRDLLEYTVEFDLPVGDYKLATLFGLGTKDEDDALGTYVPSDLSTDYCKDREDAFSKTGKDNPYLYFKLHPFTISAGSGSGGGDEASENIQLEYMVSSVSVVTQDRGSCKWPTGATNIRLAWTKSRSGFMVKDKSSLAGAEKVYSKNYNSMAFKSAKRLECWVNESVDSKLSFEFLDGENNVLEEKVLKTGSWENAKNYTITGSLGNMTLPAGRSAQSTEDANDTGFIVEETEIDFSIID